MDNVFGNFENKFKYVSNAEGKKIALKLFGFYAVRWTLRKIIK